MEDFFVFSYTVSAMSRRLRWLTGLTSQ